MTEEEHNVFKLTLSSRSVAYARYSNFAVGATLLTEEGITFSGCNVENISFGLTMCAERVALGAGVSQGYREFRLLVIVAESKERIVPCGACRQVLAEFNPKLRILSANPSGEVAEFFLHDLLPLPQQGILN